jgi:hypothetical protein
MHEWVALGHRVTVISVTEGEAAYRQWPSLGALRARELQRALRKLSTFHIPTVHLNIPDGQVRRFTNRLSSALASIVTAGATVVAPYEQDGHPDHDAIGTACLSICPMREVRALQRGPPRERARSPVLRLATRPGGPRAHRSPACARLLRAPFRSVHSMKPSPTNLADSFEALYHGNPDPWNFVGSAYERARYAATLAALPKSSYTSAFEPGCSIGELTARLAKQPGGNTESTGGQKSGQQTQGGNRERDTDADRKGTRC